MRVLLKILSIPIWFITAFLYYVTRFLGNLAVFVLGFLSLFCMAFGTIKLYEAWGNGTLLNFRTYGAAYFSGFILILMACTAKSAPETLSLLMELLLKFIVSPRKIPDSADDIES